MILSGTVAYLRDVTFIYSFFYINDNDDSDDSNDDSNDDDSNDDDNWDEGDGDDGDDDRTSFALYRLTVISLEQVANKLLALFHLIVMTMMMMIMITITITIMIMNYLLKYITRGMS